MLTEAEQEAITLAGQLHTLITKKVIGHGECRDDDVRELTSHIHDIQRFVMAQAAIRASQPGSYRLLGLSMEETIRALT